MPHSDLQAAMSATLALVERLASAQEALAPTLTAGTIAALTAEQWTLGDALLQRFVAMTGFAQLRLFPAVLSAEGEWEATLSTAEIAERLGRLGALTRPDSFLRQVRLRRDILDRPAAELTATVAQLRQVSDATPILLDAIADAVEYIYKRGHYAGLAPAPEAEAAPPEAALTEPAVPLLTDLPPEPAAFAPAPVIPVAVIPVAVPLAAVAVDEPLLPAASAPPQVIDDHQLLTDFPEELPHVEPAVAARTDPAAIVAHPLDPVVPPSLAAAAAIATEAPEHPWTFEEEDEAGAVFAPPSAEAAAEAASTARRDYGGWEYAEAEETDAQRRAADAVFVETPAFAFVPEPVATPAPAFVETGGWNYASSEYDDAAEREAALRAETEREEGQRLAAEREEARLAAREAELRRRNAIDNASGWSYSEDEAVADSQRQQAYAPPAAPAAATGYEPGYDTGDLEGYGGSAGNSDPSAGWEYAEENAPRLRGTVYVPPPGAAQEAGAPVWDDTAAAPRHNRGTVVVPAPADSDGYGGDAGNGDPNAAWEYAAAEDAAPPQQVRPADSADDAYGAEPSVGSFDWALNRLGAGRKSPQPPAARAPAAQPFYPNYVEEDPDDPSSSYGGKK